MSRYAVIRAANAASYLRAKVSGEDPPLDNFVEFAGDGDVVDEGPIHELKKRLAALRKKFPAQMKARDPKGGQFESEACEIVHTALIGYDRSALADLDFWTYLAVVHFSNLIEWRFGTSGRPAKSSNYGVGTRTENMLFRLWLRGELGCIGGVKPYDLAKSGDQDLWRSHILRQGYANVRAIARSLLKLQAGQLQAGGSKVKKLTVDHIRELAKRLKRLRANVLFEFLSSAQAEALVIELSSDIRKGK